MPVQRDAPPLFNQPPVETPKVWVAEPKSDPSPIPASLAKVEHAPLAEIHAPLDMGDFLRTAISSGRPMSEFKEALDLAERMEAIRRESLFNAAFVAFKRECPPIVRRTTDEYITVTRKGVSRKRTYASIHDVAAVVDAPLHRNGLTYDWTDAELTKDGCIVRRFILRHVAGHSRPPCASPPIPIEGGEAYKAIDAGRKSTSASPQQRMGVADTYAMRYSMISGLGLTSCDEDDESVMAYAAKDEATITERQQESIANRIIAIDDERKMMKPPGQPFDRKRFLDHFKVATFAQIPASRFDAAWDLIAPKGKP